ncbi:MAG: apolipoprotein N-acyltransferase [Deltaproteobacteria bacterium]|nr:apolipoprotein N-acyltransferase [Deltaproteobacteria bacterium]NCP97029.1 apolipoprotein N-acyltransferase [Deltaproteobacteria bacterium]NCS74121.1 apolipoprotein N-acyltransferase [Deltaproteobacteria bacterium]OIP63626.1 MAG: apolipoprotein N-acyltransferase [Nitrospirae bacterium CG2_30_70_394]
MGAPRPLWERPVGAVSMALASGLLLALALPPRPYPWLAWVGLVGLLLAVRTASRWRASLLGLLTGALYALASVYWVEGTMVRFGPLPVWLAAAATLLLALYMGGYTALWAAVAPGVIRRHRHTAPVWLATAWVALEWLRTHLFGGFGWAHLGYTQATTPAILQLAEVGGVFAISWLIVAVNAALAATVCHLAGRRPHAIQPQLLAAVAVVFAVVAFGEVRLAAIRATPLRATLGVALIQGNVPEGEKWDPARREEILHRYLSMSEGVGEGAARLIIWPEAAIPYLLQGSPQLEQLLRQVCARTGADLIFGGLWRDPTDQSYRNSAYAITAAAGVAGRYDKLHLVPFGEYVPLARLFAFVRSITAEIGDFRPGTEPTLLPVAGERVGCPICFEVTYPWLTRAFARGGATLLATVTNDAWFGTSVAPRQHLNIAAVRCVESRLPMVRAANTGITAVIDAGGQIVAEAREFETTTLTATVPLRDLPPTLYTRIGEGWLVALLIAWGLAEARREKEKAGSRK